MFRFATLLAAGTALLSGVAQAAVIVDTGISNGAVALTRPVGVQNFVYGQFTVSQATRITSVESYLTVLTGGSFRFTLWSDSLPTAPDQPGVNLFATTKTLSASTSYAWGGVSGLDWEVGAGTYWLGLAADGASTTAAANVLGNAPNPLLNEVTYTVATGNISDDGANLSWRVMGDAIVADTPAAPVPEPSSWATMILGFGLVGAGLRRRRRIAGLAAG